jgi:hypothetical protein
MGPVKNNITSPIEKVSIDLNGAEVNHHHGEWSGFKDIGRND